MKTEQWPPPEGQGHKVLLEAEYLYSNIRNEHTVQLRTAICHYEILKGICVTVPLSQLRPLPQGEGISMDQSELCS